jgi:parvulin-like peptidyl-prolyl isomerase
MFNKEGTVRGPALALLMILLLVVACAEKKEAQPAETVQPVPPGNIRASHILISYAGVPRTTATRSKEEAEQLIDDLSRRIKGGESFEEVAQAYSDCPSSEKQGDLGFFTKGRMVKPFEDAAFSLKVGGISDVVETQFGYHIIKRTQ